jgi:hypothetical protein
MISSGGPGKTKFPSIIFLGENPKKNSTIKLTFSAAPHPLAPIPTRYTPSPKYVQRRVRSFFYDIIEGGPERLNFRPSYFMGRIRKKNSTIKLAFRPSSILQRPFWRDIPLPQSKSHVGYARLFMISSGGPGKTKFLSIIFLWGESKKKLDNQIGFQAVFHPTAPIPTQ